MADPFYLVVATKPRSSQSDAARQEGTYQSRIGAAARVAFSAAPLEGALYARIAWFHDYDVGTSGDSPDVDNIIKPILDALQGVVYDDDRQIVRVVSTRHPMDGVTLVTDDLPQWAADKLNSLVYRPDTHDALYVEIGGSFDSPMVTGPVDGVTP